jgi:hypothetical protein
VEFLAFQFELGEPTGPLEQREDYLRHIVADFRVFAGTEVIYRDVDFPVLELALALAGWAEAAPVSGEEFSFESRLSALPGLIKILHGVQGWSVRSIQQELPSSVVFPLAQIVDVVEEFIAALDERVLEAHGCRVLALR